MVAGAALSAAELAFSGLSSGCHLARAIRPSAPVTTETASPSSAGVSSVVTSQAERARPANRAQLASTEAVPAARARCRGERGSMRVSLPRTGVYTQPVSEPNDLSGDASGLSEAEVRDLAALCRLAPSPEQVDRLRRDLWAVLGYAECLARAPVDDVEPMARPVDETNKLDDDEPGPTLDRSVLEGMAPSFDGVFFGVPRVLDGGGGGS